MPTAKLSPHQNFFLKITVVYVWIPELIIFISVLFDDHYCLSFGSCWWYSGICLPQGCKNKSNFWI